MSKLVTRASSINRALDEVGDKWCLLIIQEVFWGINSFNDMRDAMGVSRGVLADRLKWLQQVGCLRRAGDGGKRQRYHLTDKSIELYHAGLMAIAWEREFFSTPELDRVDLIHNECGHSFQPEMRCRWCRQGVAVWDVSYRPGAGAALDERDKKERRRSSIPTTDVPSQHSLYRNLINLVGDRWTANLIALAFHRLTRFEHFHTELPIATNILADRLRFLVEEGVFNQTPYQERPLRWEYHLTAKGEALFPWFLAVLQWGDKWCDPTGAGKPMRLQHTCCGRSLHGVACCSSCGGALKAQQVAFRLPEADRE